MTPEDEIDGSRGDSLRRATSGEGWEMAEVPPQEPQLWFGKKEGGLGFGPIARQGRVVTVLYGLLVVVAIFTYSQLDLTGFVILFYTVVFGCVVLAKSDIRKDHEAP